jgi:hypothetical protein
MQEGPATGFMTVNATGGGNVRSRTMDKPVVRIENWSVVSSALFQGYRDLQPGQRLTGDVMGHTIYTSAILNVDLANKLVETHNSLYLLGEVSEDYARWMGGQAKPRAA